MPTAHAVTAPAAVPGMRHGYLPPSTAHVAMLGGKQQLRIIACKLYLRLVRPLLEALTILASSLEHP
jgi:hypothetical protein